MRDRDHSSDLYLYEKVEEVLSLYLTGMELNHVSDVVGLSLSEVQQLMGHSSIESTKVYARHDQLLLMAKVEAANAAVFDGLSPNEALKSLPGALASKLREAAAKLDH